MMEKTYTVHRSGARTGSLPKDSYNRSLLRAALELAPEGMEITIFDLAPVSLYNADMDGEVKPEPVTELPEVRFLSVRTC
jgi:chromate reductase